VAEGLAGMVRQTSKNQLFQRVRIGNNRVKVSLSQFANDTFFPCEPSINNILAIKSMLRSFELTSGFRINFHKSKIGGVGIQEEIIYTYAKTLNCSQMKIPFTYLGLPNDRNPRKKNSSINYWER